MNSDPPVGTEPQNPTKEQENNDQIVGFDKVIQPLETVTPKSAEPAEKSIKEDGGKKESQKIIPSMRPEIKPFSSDLKIEPQQFGPKQLAAEEKKEVAPAAPQVILPDADLITLPEIKSDNVKPGIIILQWLTYAFWGWALVAMLYLIVAILAHFMNVFEFGDSVYYGIAAAVLLVPCAAVCDFLYSMHETDDKSTFSSVVMVFHAVAFGLGAITAFVVLAFSTVNAMISDSDSPSNNLQRYSALIIGFLAVALFLRVAASGKLFAYRRIVSIVLTVSCVIIVLLGLIGPAAEAKKIRNDRLIAANLSNVQDAVEEYVQDNSKLPDKLSDITLTGDAKKIVDDNLVTYKNDGKTKDYGYYTYKYQLCVTYAKKSTSIYPTSMSYYEDDTTNDYSTYLSTYSHPEGNKCYKLKTTSYNYSSSYSDYYDLQTD